MHCPYCHSNNTEVSETRVAEDGSNIRRRRLCGGCKKRFTTYERVENIMLVVKKKDDRSERFSRDKLRGGILKSVEKTTVSIEQVNKIVDEVEKELLSSDSVEVESKMIGRLVAARLKKLDKIAYIRFASVFQHFVDIEDFEREVKKLLK
jgi:transcriptional repressor NrdR